MYTKYSYKPGPQYGKCFSDKSPTATAIAKFAKKASTWFHIDVEATSHATKLARSDLIRKLNDMHEMKVIEMQASGVLNVYKILKTLPKTTEQREDLLDLIFIGMVEREQQALNRTDEMLALVTGQACFSRSLAEHFGDKLPGGNVECGHCTWCKSHKAIVQQVPPPITFNWSAFNIIKDRIPNRDDARFLARVAFGITSPRVNALKLSKDPVFGSMADHEFMVHISVPTYSMLTIIGSTQRLHFCMLEIQPILKMQKLNLSNENSRAMSRGSGSDFGSRGGLKSSLRG
jgi:hypothetical protein